MQNIIQTAGYVLAALLILDIMGFWFWAMSGQKPVDDFFIGTISFHVAEAIITK